MWRTRKALRGGRALCQQLTGKQLGKRVPCTAFATCLKSETISKFKERQTETTGRQGPTEQLRQSPGEVERAQAVQPAAPPQHWPLGLGPAHPGVGSQGLCFH